MRVTKILLVLSFIYTSNVYSNGPCDMDIQGANPKMTKEEFVSAMKSKGLFEQKIYEANKPKQFIRNKAQFSNYPDVARHATDYFTITWHDNEKGQTSINAQYYKSDLGKDVYQNRKLSICKTAEETKNIKIGKVTCNLFGGKKTIVIPPDNFSNYPQCTYGLGRAGRDREVSENLFYKSEIDTSVKLREVTKPDGKKTIIKSR